MIATIARGNQITNSKALLQTGRDLAVSVEIVHVIVVECGAPGGLLRGHADGLVREPARRCGQGRGNVRWILQQVGRRVGTPQRPGMNGRVVVPHVKVVGTEISRLYST